MTFYLHRNIPRPMPFLQGLTHHLVLLLKTPKTQPTISYGSMGMENLLLVNGEVTCMMTATLHVGGAQLLATISASRQSGSHTALLYMSGPFMAACISSSVCKASSVVASLGVPQTQLTFQGAS